MFVGTEQRGNNRKFNTNLLSIPKAFDIVCKQLNFVIRQFQQTLISSKRIDKKQKKKIYLSAGHFFKLNKKYILSLPTILPLFRKIQRHFFFFLAPYLVVGN